MRRISLAEAHHILSEHQERGHHVDSRLWEQLDRGQLFLVTLMDQDAFLSLVWQCIDGVRLLAPEGKSRTLRDVATRMRVRSLTFEALSGDLGKNRTTHNPCWFQKCEPIDREFDFKKFGTVAITPTTDGERRDSPLGSFYIYDGCHKSLVLAEKLLSSKVPYHPVQAILLLPRR